MAADVADLSRRRRPSAGCDPPMARSVRTLSRMLSVPCVVAPPAARGPLPASTVPSITTRSASASESRQQGRPKAQHGDVLVQLGPVNGRDHGRPSRRGAAARRSRPGGGKPRERDRSGSGRPPDGPPRHRIRFHRRARAVPAGWRRSLVPHCRTAHERDQFAETPRLRGVEAVGVFHAYGCGRILAAASPSRVRAEAPRRRQNGRRKPSTRSSVGIHSLSCSQAPSGPSLCIDYRPLPAGWDPGQLELPGLSGFEHAQIASTAHAVRPFTFRRHHMGAEVRHAMEAVLGAVRRCAAEQHGRKKPCAAEAGRPATALQLKTLDGESLPPGPTSRDTPSCRLCWATWCAPCIKAVRT